MAAREERAPTAATLDWRIKTALRDLRGATTGGTVGLTAWTIAAHIGASVDATRRRCRYLADVGHLDMTPNPLDRRSWLYSECTR